MSRRSCSTVCWRERDSDTRIDIGTTHQIAVRMSQSATRPAMALVTQTDDLSRLGAAWFGLTGSTANSSESHHILRWKLAVMP